MSHGTLDRNTFEAIEAYVLDRMDADERSFFEQRMAKEPGLLEEVEFEHENIRAVELGGVTRMLKVIAQEERTTTVGLSGNGWGTFLKYAAVIALIATGAIWWFTRAPLNERLFAAHFVADPGLPVEMGLAADPSFADAMVYYKEGRYAEARAKWLPMLQQELQNDTLRFYIGNAALAEGDAEAAIAQLSPLVTNTSASFHHKAQWYLFLAYVRIGREADAVGMELERDREYGERVRGVIAELD